jgi:hypothetical protein
VLSDACQDFYYFKDAITNKDLKQLMDQVEWYGQPHFDYPPEHINRLKVAIRAVVDNPNEKRLADHLLTLCETIRAYYDSPPEL